MMMDPNLNPRQQTRIRIMNPPQVSQAIMMEQPKYPVWITTAAVEFMSKILVKSAQKRPDILTMLTHPWIMSAMDEATRARVDAAYTAGVSVGLVPPPPPAPAAPRGSSEEPVLLPGRESRGVGAHHPDHDQPKPAPRSMSRHGVPWSMSKSNASQTSKSTEGSQHGANRPRVALSGVKVGGGASSPFDEGSSGRRAQVTKRGHSQSMMSMTTTRMSNLDLYPNGNEEMGGVRGTMTTTISPSPQARTGSSTSPNVKDEAAQRRSRALIAAALTRSGSHDLNPDNMVESAVKGDGSGKEGGKPAGGFMHRLKGMLGVGRNKANKELDRKRERMAEGGEVRRGGGEQQQQQLERS